MSDARVSEEAVKAARFAVAEAWRSGAQPPNTQALCDLLADSAVEAAAPILQREEGERIREALEAKAVDYEWRLARGDWSLFNTREQVAGWGQGVRAALVVLDSRAEPDS